MNRRSMLSAVIGACVAMFLPWRKTAAEDGAIAPVRNPKHIGVAYGNSQAGRIRRLLETESRRLCGVWNKLSHKLPDGLKRTSYEPTIQRCRPGADCIHVWWDERKPDESGLYGVGLVILPISLAASLSDRKLTKHLMNAMLVSLSPPYVSRQGLFDEFKGKPVIMLKGKTIGAEFNKTE